MAPGAVGPRTVWALQLGWIREEWQLPDRAGFNEASGTLASLLLVQWLHTNVIRAMRADDLNGGSHSRGRSSHFSVPHRSNLRAFSGFISGERAQKGEARNLFHIQKCLRASSMIQFRKVRISELWRMIASALISTRAPPSSIKAAARLGILHHLLLQQSETRRGFPMPSVPLGCSGQTRRRPAGTDRKPVLIPPNHCPSLPKLADCMRANSPAGCRAAMWLPLTGHQCSIMESPQERRFPELKTHKNHLFRSP